MINVNMETTTQQYTSKPDVESTDALGIWAASVLLQKRRLDGSNDLILQLAIWSAASEHEAIGKAIDYALNGNAGYAVATVAIVIITEPKQ